MSRDENSAPLPVAQPRIRPKYFRGARWRNTLPMCPVERTVGLGLDMPDGSVQRMVLSEEDARHIARTLRWAIRQGLRQRARLVEAGAIPADRR